MKIKAVQTVIFDGARIRPGQVADLPDAEAQVLIAQGFAVPAPADAPAPAPEPAPEPAQAEPAGKPRRQKADG